MKLGDIVAVNHGTYGRTEGLVIGSHVDYAVSPTSPLHARNVLTYCRADKSSRSSSSPEKSTMLGASSLSPNALASILSAVVH